MLKTLKNMMLHVFEKSLYSLNLVFGKGNLHHGSGICVL
jgi:hypothetical protein